MGLSAIKRPDQRDPFFKNKGGLAEQFVGQQLRSMQTPSVDPQLFYWQRTGGRLGEIDYILQHENQVVPVEVKSGPAGKMKSLPHFAYFGAHSARPPRPIAEFLNFHSEKYKRENPQLSIFHGNSGQFVYQMDNPYQFLCKI